MVRPDREPALETAPKARRLRRRPQPGAAPGTLVASPDAPPPVMEIVAIGAESVRVLEPGELRGALASLGSGEKLWVDVRGLGDAALLQEMAETFALHPLTVEDICHTHQRAKVEIYPGYNFAVIRMPTQAAWFDTEQLAIVFGERFVLTFQESTTDDLLALRQRLGVEGSRLRAAGTDYLAYAILDTVVDHYFPILEDLSGRLDLVESQVVQAYSAKNMGEIHQLRGILSRLRRACWPIREAISGLTRDQVPLVAPETRVFLRDVQDHAMQIIDVVESLSLIHI